MKISRDTSYTIKYKGIDYKVKVYTEPEDVPDEILEDMGYDKEEWVEACDDYPRNVLAIYQNNVLIEFHVDKGSSESNTFDRSYACVAPAIEYAYKQGLEDAQS